MVRVDDVDPILACPCAQGTGPQRREDGVSQETVLTSMLVQTNGCQDCGPSASTYARRSAVLGKKVPINRQDPCHQRYLAEAGQVGVAEGVIVHAAAVQQLPKGCLLVGDRCDHLSNPLSARTDERVHTGRIKIGGIPAVGLDDSHPTTAAASEIGIARNWVIQLSNPITELTSPSARLARRCAPRRLETTLLLGGYEQLQSCPRSHCRFSSCRTLSQRLPDKASAGSCGDCRARRIPPKVYGGHHLHRDVRGERE